MKKRVKNKTELVYGVGINDADYQVMINETIDGKDKILWRCPYYVKWTHMIARCYSERELEKYPTYRGCVVCEEWLYFSNFREWMIQQEWEDRCLDKDFLVENNKVYSPSTCVFVPSKVNVFITARGNDRGKYPLGVFLFKETNKKPYRSRCSNGSGKRIHLGYFSTPEEAHQAWLVKKLEVCNEYLIEYKDEPLIAKGLTRIKQKLEHHINTNTELTSF